MSVHGRSQFAPRGAQSAPISSIPSYYYARGRSQGGTEAQGWPAGRCRLTLDSGVGLPYLYSSLILSYHFALRQVNRLPAYRKPSERSLGQSGLGLGPPTTRKASHGPPGLRRLPLLAAVIGVESEPPGDLPGFGSAMGTLCCGTVG